jgi:uncharacterized repeat protein (TIGR04138 family)
MGHGIDFWEVVRQIRAKDSRFEPEAYPFVLEALEFTLERLGERRHVSATELLDGMCIYSRERFGLLAGDVLNNWGIRNAFDVGLAVFQLVEARVLAKQESDRLEDFDVDYDLRGTLEDRYFD